MNIIAATMFMVACVRATSNGEVATETNGPLKTKGIDTTLYTIIPFYKTWFAPFDTSYGAAKLTRTDINKLETLLINCVSHYNENLDKDVKRNKSIDLIYGRYKRQYIPRINSMGQIEVWVNCLCENDNSDYWKSKIIYVHDGGKCFIQLVINLSTGNCSQLAVNGSA